MTRWCSSCVAAWGLAVALVVVPHPRSEGWQPAGFPAPAELMAEVPKRLGPQVPFDVDIALKKKLEGAKKFAEVQLQFDILSWESLVAVCWPVDAAGKPQPKLSDPGNPLFTTWRTNEEVFAPGAVGPVAWGAKPTSPLFVGKGVPEGERVMRLTSAVAGNPNDLRDVKQAFSYPLWDQNGNMLRYEIFINADEYDFIETNKLYTIAGQVAFSEKKNVVTFPSGDASKKVVGAVELKLAWKVLGKNDVPERFLVTGSHIIGSGGKPVKAKLGLVGVHRPGPHGYSEATRGCRCNCSRRERRALKPSAYNSFCFSCIFFAIVL